MFLLALELSEPLTDLVGRFHYLGPFLVLLLCGVGLPLPEEVTLIAAGLLLHEGEVEFVPITLVCAAAILLGDSIPYSLGRRYGLDALRNRFVSKVLHPERFAIVEEKFARHGSWVVFLCRFLPGIRIPAYFTAGTLKMSFPRFLLLDGLGVLISVPTSIYIAMLFGGQVEKLQARIDNFHLVVTFALIAVLGVVIFRILVGRRSREAQSLAARGASDAHSVRNRPPGEGEED